MKFWKGQELDKTEPKARNQREQIFFLQGARGQLGSDERKAKTGTKVEENVNFSIQLFLARHPHCITIGRKILQEQFPYPYPTPHPHRAREPVRLEWKRMSICVTGVGKSLALEDKLT